jgi:hypothetical protein
MLQGDRSEPSPCCRTVTGKDQAMSRWRELVDNLLTDLKTEAPGADGFRVNIDNKIWEAEQTVSNAVTTPYETTVRRLHGFQRELIETLSKQLKNDPANETLLEARSLKTRGSASPNIGDRT